MICTCHGEAGCVCGMYEYRVFVHEHGSATGFALPSVYIEARAHHAVVARRAFETDANLLTSTVLVIGPNGLGEQQSKLYQGKRSRVEVSLKRI